MNHIMLQCLALCAIVMVATSTPWIPPPLQRDKLKLNNLIRGLGNTIDELELDIEAAEKRNSFKEPIIEPEISEDETQAREEEERSDKRRYPMPGVRPEINDIYKKGYPMPEVRPEINDIYKKAYPRPEFSDADSNDEEKKEKEARYNKDGYPIPEFSDADSNNEEKKEETANSDNNRLRELLRTLLNAERPRTYNAKDKHASQM